MNSTWQNFLRQQAAAIEGGVVQHFGDASGELAATRDGTVLCDLGQFGLLRAGGEDAQTFLQNMLSCDVRDANEQRASYGSLNSPKGRMLATFLIWRSGGDYYLHLPRSLCTTIQKKLSMYVLRAKVRIEDVSEQQVCLGLAGTGAAALLQSTLGTAPQEAMASARQEDTTIIHLGGQRYLLASTAEQAAALWQRLSAAARPAGSTCWDWLTIRAGIPVITPPTQEQFVPQMANLELIGGVSFKKGCYPGQEIVARTQHLGKVKRRMYLAHLPAGATVQAGDALYSADMADQPCGMVVNAAHAPDSGHDLLAVLHISSREAQTVHIHALQGVALEFLPLPYLLP